MGEGATGRIARLWRTIPPPSSGNWSNCLEISGSAASRSMIANIVATILAYDITCLLICNVNDFERFGEIITIKRIDND